MRRARQRLSLAAALAFALGVSMMASPCRASDDLLEQGRRIYEHGIGVGGEPLQATLAGDLVLRGAQAACASCHRRSGMGGREGRVVIPPVAGSILFSRAEPTWPVRTGREPRAIEPLRHESRQAYDDEHVVRALREGVDSEGRPLEPVMPRYWMQAEDEAALVSYLRRLGRDNTAGPRQGVLHLATVITPDADPHRAETVARAMQAWSRSGALGGMPIDLRIWRLEGPAASWGEQLRDWQRQHQPYALLSGAGGSQWGAVRDFCERQSLPCLFPSVDFAPDDGEDHYSVYFSRGVVLEARLLARHLLAHPTGGRVVQWIDPSDGGAGAAAAAQLRGDLGGAPSTIVEIADDRSGGFDPRLQPGDVVVAWLRPAMLRRLVASHPEAFADVTIHLSARLAPPQSLELPVAWRRAAVWISAGSDPARLRGKGVLGLVPWTQRLGIALDDEALLSEVYAATYFFGDALSRMKGRWQRDWLMETIESSHFTRPAGGAFFSLSLAPGQREAAKAGHLLKYLADDDVVSAVGPRLAP